MSEPAPVLQVILFTAVDDADSERADYATETLAVIMRRIATDWPGKWRIHIADDGSPHAHTDRLMGVVDRLGGIARSSVSNSGRRGYGASYNAATQRVHAELRDADVILPLEDDWLAVAPLELERFTRALQDRQAGIDCIRMGYLGWTGELSGTLVAAGDRSGHDWEQEHYLRFDPTCTERHVFAGHPRLETLAFQRRLGIWPEGLGAGATEAAVCGRVESRIGVAWPLGVTMPLFEHIGTVRAREE